MVRGEDYIVLGLLGLGILASAKKSYLSSVKDVQVKKTEEGKTVVESRVVGEPEQVHQEAEAKKEVEPTTGQEITRVSETVSFSGFQSVWTPEERKQIESSPPSETPLPALTLQYEWKEIAPGVKEGVVIFPMEVEVWIPSIPIDRLRQIHRELQYIWNTYPEYRAYYGADYVVGRLGYLLVYWRDDFGGFVEPDRSINIQTDILDNLSRIISSLRAESAVRPISPELISRLEAIYNELSTLTFTKKKMWTYTL